MDEKTLLCSYIKRTLPIHVRSNGFTDVYNLPDHSFIKVYIITRQDFSCTESFTETKERV